MFSRARLPQCHCHCPFPDSVISNLTQDHVPCHRPTVIRETVPLMSKHPTSPTALLAVSRFGAHHGLSSLTECITQSWWRAHQTKLAANVSQPEYLVVLFGPTDVFFGVFSLSRRILLQVTDPPLSLGRNLASVSNLSAHVAFEAFSFAFRPFLHFCLCIYLLPWALQWIFLLPKKLRPRLAIARHFLRCALPLASRGRILGSLTLFTLSFAPVLRSRVERLDNCTQDSVSFGSELVSFTPSLDSSAKSSVTSRSFKWSTSGSC